MKTFNEQVYDIVAKIPQGRVITYGEIARMIGRPKAAQFVGFAMNNPKVEHLPWHRVTFVDGRLCGQWSDLQYKTLKAEGVTFVKDKKTGEIKIDVKKHQWTAEHDGVPMDMDLRDFPLVF